MRRSIAVTKARWVIATCLVALSTTPGVCQSYQLIISTEYNASSSITKLGGPSISITALLLKPDGTMAGAGVPITFEAVPFFDDGTVSKTVNTDSRGRATVSSAPVDVLFSVSAKYVRSMVGVIASASINIPVTQENCNLSGQTPATIGWVLFANPNAIKWRYEGTSTNLFGQVQIGMTSWHNATGRVTFSGPTAAGLPVDLVFVDDCVNHDISYAYAVTDIRADGARVIHFYKSQLNPDPDPLDTDCFGVWPPYSARHHLISTATHEIGHALGLGHNTASRSSIMWVGIDKLFVCGVAGPTQDAVDTVRALYP